MKSIFTVILLLVFAYGLLAQDTPRVTFHIWVDAFGTNQGTVLYPQYGWGVNTTSMGKISGYGFVESTPHEQMFTNHLLIYTPPKINFFSVHTETGSYPVHNLGFFQLGPRVNFTEAVPQLKKPLHHLFVAVLPRFIGIRPNNILISGATNPVKVKGVAVWGEAYRRFFTHGSAYGEYWVLIKPTPKSPFSFGVLAHHNGDNSYVGIGLRVSFF